MTRRTVVPGGSTSNPSGAVKNELTMPTEAEATDHDALDDQWYDESQEYDPSANEANEYGESHTADADESYDAEEDYTDEEYDTETYREEYGEYADEEGYSAEDEYADEIYPTEGEESATTTADEVATVDTDEVATTEEDGTDASVDHSDVDETVATELPIDPALVRVIANWHQLSPESRKAIISLVQQEALQTTLDD
jgi:hypothetical protein